MRLVRVQEGVVEMEKSPTEVSDVRWTILGGRQPEDWRETDGTKRREDEEKKYRNRTGGQRANRRINTFSSGGR